MPTKGERNSGDSASRGQELDPHDPVGDAVQHVDLSDVFVEQAHAALAGADFETSWLEDMHSTVSIEEAYRIGCELCALYEDRLTYMTGVDHVYNLYWNYDHDTTFDDAQRLHCDLCRSL